MNEFLLNVEANKKKVDNLLQLCMYGKDKIR